METKRVLVTGAAGFIGSWIVDECIKEGHEVIGADNLLGGYMDNVNKDCDFRVLDLRDKEKTNELVKGTDVVFHVAAYAAEGQSFFSPIAINDINITPMNNLLVAVVNNDVSRFVFTSSMAVYGEQKPPFEEKMLRNPVDPYGASKAYCENVLEIFSKVYGFEHVIIRPHNVYGPRQNIYDPYRNVLGIWINRITRGKPPIIYGDGNQMRAFSYIEDVAPAIVNAGFNDKAVGEIINVGSDEVVTINEACKIVSEVMQSDLQPIHHPPRLGEVKYAYSTIAKSIELLNYRKRYSLSEGCKKMAVWARQKGPGQPTYILPLEIQKKAPEVWLERTM